MRDLLAGRWDESIKRLRERQITSAEHRRTLRALRRIHGAPLERLAADLRRLREVVRADAHRSAAQQIGNQTAESMLLFVIAAAVYIVIALLGGATGSVLERRLAVQR